MLIGLTYDLRDDYLREGYTEEETAEFDRPSTIEAIEITLRQLGYQTERIGHARSLVTRLAKGDRWDLVFNIAEGLYGHGREALVPALLDAYKIPYTFSDPMTLTLALHKAHAKRVLRDAGVPTPDFAVVARPADIAGLNLPYPLFAKPLAEGTGKGVDARSCITGPEQAEQVCRDLLARFHQPVLVERFLPGREVTVGLVGTGEAAEVIGALEVVLLPRAEAQVYSYFNKENCEDLIEYRLVTDDALNSQAAGLALAAWRVLECRDGGRVDLRADESGRLQVIELNPLAGLHPEHSDLPILATKAGIAYPVLMDRIMRSALLRYSLEPPQRPNA
ncbi:MAG TPA: D-alanine--D-alanine ligase [Myxococcota bacterium]|nr:D-alanine--D-alanine ligase [Myxococcota bacterium]